MRLLDQRRASLNLAAQFNYAVLLEKGDGIAMNKSFVVHYYKLSAD
jgi:TPR repeat protein